MEEESRALSYAEMREQNLFTDAVIKSSSGREWRVHKVVMSSSGRFFSTAFSYPSFTGTLDLGVRDHVVQAIVDSAYEGTCDVDAENSLEILSAAFMYQLEELVKTCVAFAVANMMTPEYAIAVKVFARIHREGFETFERSDFIDILDRFIRRNFIDIYERSDIYELSFNEIEAIVKEDDLNIPEDELLDFILEYVSFHHLDTEKAMELLCNVRLDFIDSAKISQAAKENQILGNEIERRKIVNVRFTPRFPRDIIIAPRTSAPQVTEIFNVRKNEWKPIGMDEVMKDILYFRSVLVDNIIYKIQVNGLNGHIKVRGFNLASGQFLEEKETEFPYEIGYLYPHFTFVAWNGGIVFSLESLEPINSNSIAYYKPGENRWQLFQPTKNCAEYVVVNGILFTMGGIDHDNEQALFNGEGTNDNENEDHIDASKEIRYYDPKTNVWVLCGVFKKRAHVRAVAVGGKVYAFSMYGEYGECFQPVLTDDVMSLKWFPEVKIPFKKENCQMEVLDNKIIFIGGFEYVEDDTDNDMESGWRKECHVFSPRTREWSRVSNLSVSKDGGEAIKIDTSKVEVCRIEEICNGQLVVPND